MKILFLKTRYLDFYKEDSEDQKVEAILEESAQLGFGQEENNFEPTVLKEDKGVYLFGYVDRQNAESEMLQIKLENIQGSDVGKDAEILDDVLVVWCAEAPWEALAVIGWYNHANVYRNCQRLETSYNGKAQAYFVRARMGDCVLLPEEIRKQEEWLAPQAQRQGFGFSSANIWYVSEGDGEKFSQKIVQQVREYKGANDLKKRNYEEI